MKSSFSKTFTFLLIISVAHSTHSQTTQKYRFKEWHTTHDIEKFPCMNEKETELFKKIKDASKVEERKKTVRQTTKAAVKEQRGIASTTTSFFDKSLNKRFVCPPFHFVRKPYPGTEAFGKTDMFERVKLTQSNLKIIDGLSRGQDWPITFKTGYAEGKTGKGTPMRLTPLNPEEGTENRFLIQTIIWPNGSAPLLTLCYPEELHEQCNPYKDPSEIKKPTGVAQK